MREIRKKAMAKINLGLDVLRRREDGYHEVRMIMQTVDLYDDVFLRLTRAPGIRMSVDRNHIPNGPDNLAWKAAALLMETMEKPEYGIYIDLKKHIPVAAGLAGGSSDAAAVLTGMNELFSLGFSREELMRMGKSLGADVPYCVMGGTALSEGIGEILTPLSPLPECWIVLAKPDAHVSTKYVYENLKLDAGCVHPDIDSQLAALENGDIKGVCAAMGNLLETVTVKECPVISRISSCMKEEGAAGAMMSGSGPTVFGIFEDKKCAQSAVEKLRRIEGVRKVVLARPFNP